MQNIFLLPTDTGKLYKCNQGFDYSFLGTFTGYQKDIVCQNIYITSDEEIKEGDWTIYLGNLVKVTSLEGKTFAKEYCKKIILTTDQDLIKDGVQKVNSSFLSFYAENTPNYVEVDDYIERVGWESDENGRDMILNKRFYSLNFPPKEIKTEENVIDQWLEKYGNPEIMKQVEKEAELYQTINKIIDGGKNLPKGFEVSRGQAIDYAFDVALEVAEKLYTEEDLHNAFYNGWIYRGENYTFPKAKKEWSDENKK